MSIIIPVALSILFFISFLIIRYIRKEYRKYCRIQDLKDNIEFNKLKIKGAINYISSKYNDDLNRAIIVNILPKINFCQNLINQRSLEDQDILTKKLFDMIYETNHRLTTDIDVNIILSPINTFYRELASYKLKEVVEIVDNH